MDIYVNRKKLLRRVGCGLLLIPWLICMFVPCFVVALVMNQEVIITYSDLPEDALRIWVLDSSGIAGVGIDNSRRVSAANNLTCNIIDTNFLIWRGNADKAGVKSAHRCNCYKRDANRWLPILSGEQACIAAESK